MTSRRQFMMTVVPAAAALGMMGRAAHAADKATETEPAAVGFLLLQRKRAVPVGQMGRGPRAVLRAGKRGKGHMDCDSKADAEEANPRV